MHNITSPATDDNAIENEIIAKGKTAPRVTPTRIQDVIKDVYYFTAADAFKAPHLVAIAGDPPISLGLLTFCVIVLANGFTVTGESACASPENFDAEIGKKIAFENAKQKIWPLEGYLLKSQLTGN